MSTTSHIPNLEIYICFIMGLFACLLVLIALFQQKLTYWAKTEKSPQTEKLLRPAGYSLEKRLDDAYEKLLLSAMMATLFWGIAGGLGSISIRVSIPMAWTICTIMTAFVLFGAGILMLLECRRRLNELRRVKLGLRGEQAVAEALHGLMDSGFRVFHDLQGGDNWNIDHVAVGDKGVFAIETKARRKKRTAGGQPNYVVRVEDRVLVFPNGADRKAIPQAERNAKWLANLLSKKTGEAVFVEPLVVIPGWFVENKTAGLPIVKVMNASYLTGFLARQEEKLPAAQVRRIIAVLDEKCRDVEF